MRTKSIVTTGSTSRRWRTRERRALFFSLSYFVAAGDHQSMVTYSVTNRKAERLLSFLIRPFLKYNVAMPMEKISLVLLPVSVFDDYVLSARSYLLSVKSVDEVFLLFFPFCMPALYLLNTSSPSQRHIRATTNFTSRSYASQVIITFFSFSRSFFLSFSLSSPHARA